MKADKEYMFDFVRVLNYIFLLLTTLFILVDEVKWKLRIAKQEQKQVKQNDFSNRIHLRKWLCAQVFGSESQGESFLWWKRPHYDPTFSHKTEPIKFREIY